VKEKFDQDLLENRTVGRYDLETPRGMLSKLIGFLRRPLPEVEVVMARNDVREEVTVGPIVKTAETTEQSEAEDSGEFRRKSGDRRIRYRRDTRPAAMVPDRRKKIRRMADVEHFETLVSNREIIPIGLSSYEPDK